MENKLEKDVRFLKIYAVVATLAGAIVVLTAFSMQSGKRNQRIAEIDAERINIVEKDGRTDLVIANADELLGPGNIVTGKFGKRVGPKAPGILFYNEKGDECGGLQWVSRQKDGRYVAGAQLAFDKYNGDQVVGVRFQEANKQRQVGFNVWDQPDVS